MHDPTKSRYRYIAFRNGNYRRYVHENGEVKKDAFKPAAVPDIPAHGSYGGILFDKRWRARRLQILQRDGHACVICNSTANLQVHHRQYHFKVNENQFRAPWEYEDRLLITLCEPCHKRGHNKYKVPTINI